MSPPEEDPPVALLADFSKPSPPILISRPRPIIVLHELKSTAAAATTTVSERILFIEILISAI